jgi:hypothetical protein
MNTIFHQNKGFATIMLMALSAMLLILFVLLLPSQEETIRARVEQGLHQADLAKTALTTACRQGSRRTVSDNADIGFFFVESLYVADIRLTADCASGNMGIHIRTQNTGADTDPEILLISGTAEGTSEAGSLSSGGSRSEWRCGLARGEAEHVPEDCRAALTLG